MIEMVQFQYANHWAIVKDGVVLQCFLKETAAKQAAEKLKLA